MNVNFSFSFHDLGSAVTQFVFFPRVYAVSSSSPADAINCLRLRLRMKEKHSNWIKWIADSHLAPQQLLNHMCHPPLPKEESIAFRVEKTNEWASKLGLILFFLFDFVVYSVFSISVSIWIILNDGFVISILDIEHWYFKEV